MATDLQVTTNKLSNKETQLTVKVPVEKIQNKVEGRIRQVAKTAKIDGFRKGNVPMSHIRSQYGAGIQQEVINDVIRDTVFEAIKSEDIRAVGMPNIDDVKLEDDFLVYQATVEIFPEIDVQGIDEIEVERHTATVSDEDVDTMIEPSKSNVTWLSLAALPFFSTNSSRCFCRFSIMVSTSSSLTVAV